MSGYADLSRVAYISPNDLMQSTLVNYYPQQLQAKAQNDLLTNQHNEQLIDAQRVEYFARAAGGLAAIGKPGEEGEAERAAAYPAAVAALPPSLRERAPAQYPGWGGLQRAIALGTSSEKQGEQAGVATSATNWRGPPGAPGGGGTAGGAAPARPGGGSATRGELEGGPPAAGTPGAAVAQRVHDFWRGRGFTEEQTAGIMAGGPGSESDFTPGVLGDKGTSYGLYQHHGPRWEAMKQRYGTANPTEAQQNDFAYWEITEGPLHGIADRLRTARTPAEAATIWTRDFGVPGDKTEIDRRARGAGRYHGIYAGAGAPAGGAPPPGVQMGGAPPGPPGGAPGPYGGGGFGTALNPTAPTAPVARTPPAPGGRTASNDLSGDVNAMLAGINRAQTTPMGGVMAAGPAAPTAPERQVSSVEPPPQPGWGTAVGSYGDGAAAPVAPPATTPPPGAAQPPATTTPPPPPPAAAMPPALQLNERNLTAADEAEFDYRAPRLKTRTELQQFYTDIEQRKRDNTAAIRHWETQQTAVRKEAAAAADAANPVQSKGSDADHLRVLQKYGPRVRRGEPLTEAEADEYDAHRRDYAEGPPQVVTDSHGGTMQVRMGREISDRFPPLPGQKEYAGVRPIPGTQKPPEMASPAVVGGMLANVTGMAKVLKAQQALDEYSSAVGMKGNLPEFILQRGDPEGVSARTAISDVGGHEFHDMSGAAISQSEGRRLTYIPSTQDTERAVKTKLQNLLENNREILLKGYLTYGPENNGRRLPEVEAAIVESIPEVARDALKKDKDAQAGKKFDRVFGRGAAQLVLNYDG